MLHRMNWHPPEKLRMAEWKVFGHMASKVWVQALQVGNKPRRSRRLATSSAEAGYSTCEVQLASLPLTTGMRVCYNVLSVQLVQDMHVIPRCWSRRALSGHCVVPVVPQPIPPSGPLLKGSALKGSYAKVMASWVSPPSAVKFEECFGLGLEAVHFPGFAQLSSHLVPLCTGVVATQADVKERVVFSPASPFCSRRGRLSQVVSTGTNISMRRCHVAVSPTATPSHGIFTKFSVVRLTRSPPCAGGGCLCSRPCRRQRLSWRTWFFRIPGRHLNLSPRGMYGICRPPHSLPCLGTRWGQTELCCRPCHLLRLVLEVIPRPAYRYLRSRSPDSLCTRTQKKWVTLKLFAVPKSPSLTKCLRACR